MFPWIRIKITEYGKKIQAGGNYDKDNNRFAGVSLKSSNLQSHNCANSKAFSVKTANKFDFFHKILAYFKYLL